jgi:hypothetical protein
MKVCNEIKWRIDESDHPDQLNLEISRHTSDCVECRTYAEERARLRSLLVGSARVGVPVNFDAMLNARLAEVKTQKSFAWLSPALYLQLGTASAVLAVMFFAAQYSNLFSSNYQATQAVSSSAIKARFHNSPLATAQAIRDANYDFNNVAPRPYPQARYNAVRINRFTSRPPDGYVSFNDGGVILVRGQNGEREVPVQTVSVGAQPLLYSSRQPQLARSVSTF